MNINLVLTHHWFDETKSGRKRVEYRSQQTYNWKTYQFGPSVWVFRLWNKRHMLKTVSFTRGYTPTKIRFRITKIDKGPCPIKGFGSENEEFIRIHFTDETQPD